MYSTLFALFVFFTTSAYAEQIIKLPEVSYSGTLRFEGTYTNTDIAGGATTKTSDLKASKAEIVFNAKMSDQVSGFATITWGGNDSSPVELDETAIIISPINWPLTFSLGKQNVPFGVYHGNFMSTELTTMLGETQEHSINATYTAGIAKISAGIYNGDIHKTGQGDHIDAIAAKLDLNFSDNFSTGVSVISNIAESNTLQGSDGVNNSSIQDTVAGISANILYKFDQLTFTAEYVGALDEFAAGELAFDSGNRYQPQTASFEAGYNLSPKSVIAARFETGDDGGNVIPENTYGIYYSMPLLEYLLFESEYVKSKYENNDEKDIIKLRLELEF